MKLMKLMNRKTRKAIRKDLKKAINKHGPAIAAGLVGGIASTLATLANNDELGNDAKSKVSKLSEKVRRVVGHEDSRKRSSTKSKAAKRTGKSFNSGAIEDGRLPASRG
jgi:type VI protein secretion system component VasK